MILFNISVQYEVNQCLLPDTLNQVCLQFRKSKGNCDSILLYNIIIIRRKKSPKVELIKSEQMIPTHIVDKLKGITIVYYYIYCYNI